MEKTNALAVLNNIELNAAVSLDDIVNVFISRYETTCHDQFSEVQARLKENGQALKALDLEVLVKLKEDFVTADQVISRNFMFETKQSFGQITIDWPNSAASINVTHTTMTLNGVKLGGYSGKDTDTNNFTVRVNMYEHFAAAHKRLTEEGTKIREELMVVNHQLQQVDRKARQVKGFIAERKLEQAGMSALLENVELAQLIQLK